jgi:hypothetical protein
MASQIFNYLNCLLYCYKALDASIKWVPINYKFIAYAANKLKLLQVTQCTSATNASNKSQILQVPYNRCAPNTALMAECFRCASTALRKTAQMIANVLQIL